MLFGEVSGFVGKVGGFCDVIVGVNGEIGWGGGGRMKREEKYVYFCINEFKCFGYMCV